MTLIWLLQRSIIEKKTRNQGFLFLLFHKDKFNYESIQNESKSIVLLDKCIYYEQYNRKEFIRLFMSVFSLYNQYQMTDSDRNENQKAMNEKSFEVSHLFHTWHQFRIDTKITLRCY